jgi:hypothetical protein
MTALAHPQTSARLIDWRFLLPVPRGGAFEHLILLGGSPAIVETVLELGVARRVSTAPAGDDEADAVVILAGATGSVNDAVRALRQDGVLYWEVDRRTPHQLSLTPARAMNRLARRGLTATAAYWVKPGFPERQMFLPLGATGAFRWYLNTLYRSTSRARRAVKAGLRAVATSSRGLAALAPCYAITAVRGTPRPAAAVAGACTNNSVNANQFDAVFLAHGTAEWNRMAVLLFEPQASAPIAAVKVSRRAVYNGQLEWEHHCLDTIRAGLDARLRSSLPSSSLSHLNDLALSVETCVRGAALSSRTGGNDRRMHDDLQLAAEWLGDFHRATTIERVPARAWLAEHLVARFGAEYASAFGLTDSERALFATIARRLEASDAVALPIVWQHTDFGPWNVYRDGRHASVIDWEVARRGPALVDLLYFITHWRTGAAGEAVPADALACGITPPRDSGNDAVRKAIQRQMTEYMRRVQMSSSLFPFLLVYMAVEQALDRARRFTVLDRPEAAGREGNRYVAYVGVLARQTERLFNEETCRAA